MSVKASDLSNPEQGMDLTDRDPRGADKVAKDIQRVKTGKPTAESELQEIRVRLETARSLTPPDTEKHCRDCWDKGRNAAIRTIEGDKGA